MRARPRELNLSKSPGPGKYEVESAITKDGKHILSQMKNSGMPTFNPASSRRFQEKQFCKFFIMDLMIDKDVPGIGTYDVGVEFKKNKGVYVLSQFQSVPGKSLSRSKRVTYDTSNQSPGPGAYKLPSLF